MSQQIQIVCDYCGAIKKESNHWYQIDSSKVFLTIYVELKINRLLKDACGHRCVQKAVEEFLNQK